MTTDNVQIPPSDNVPPEANRFLQMLNWVYDSALNGIPSFEGSRVYAANTRGTPTDRISNVIGWSTATAGAVGAVTSIGGLITLPISLPANLVGTFFVQIRMVQSIAIIAGKDPLDDRVRTMAFLACLGMSVTDVLKGIGISVAHALADQFVKDVVAQALAKAVVRGVIARTAKKSILSSVYRAVPVLSAGIGGTIDAVATYTIGSSARGLFLPNEIPTNEVPA
jgi:hypothetical protein